MKGITTKLGVALLFFSTLGASLAIVQPCSCATQGMHEVWHRMWGGASYDGANALAIAADGIYMSGYTNSFGMNTTLFRNAFLAKYTADGALLWNQTWARAYNDRAFGVAAAAHGIYIAGETFGNNSIVSSNAFLAKYFANGTSAWNRTWGGANQDNAYGVAASADGVYLAGETYSFGMGTPASPNAFLAKYFANGTSAWNRTWAGTNTDQAYGVAAAADGIYVAGFTNSFGAGGEAFLAKYSLDGTSLWNRTWGGADFDQGYAVAIGSDGVYLTGYTNCFGAGDFEAFLAKFSAADGTSLWNRTWGGVGCEYGEALAVTTDRIYMTGQTDSFGAGSYDSYLAKYTTDGTLAWNSTWGSTGNDKSHAVVAIADNAYFAGDTTSFGTLNGGAYLAKFVPLLPDEIDPTIVIIAVVIIGAAAACVVIFFVMKKRRGTRGVKAAAKP